MARIPRQSSAATATPTKPTVTATAVSTTREQERVRLLGSGLIQRFVRDKNGAWNHQDWLDFLTSVRSAGYRTLSDDEVGQMLEEEKGRFWASKR